MNTNDPTQNYEAFLAQQRIADRARRRSFLARIAHAIAMFFYDPKVRKAERVVAELEGTREHIKTIAGSQDEQRRVNELARMLRNSWFVFIAAFVAATADVLFVLPNFVHDLASRFAGGDEPAPWQIWVTRAALESAIFILLLAVKARGETKQHRAARDDAPNERAHRNAVAGLRAAWFWRTAYIAMIFVAFGLNILAEKHKADIQRIQTETVERLAKSQETRLTLDPNANGAPAPVAAGPAAESAGSSSWGMVAGVFMLLASLHVVILFMPAGYFGKRSLGDLTRAELEMRERQLARARGPALLRLNAKLAAAKSNQIRHDAMMERTPKSVRQELAAFMGEHSGLSTTPVAASARAADHVVARTTLEPVPDADAWSSATNPSPLTVVSSLNGNGTRDDTPQSRTVS